MRIQEKFQKEQTDRRTENMKGGTFIDKGSGVNPFFVMQKERVAASTSLRSELGGVDCVSGSGSNSNSVTLSAESALYDFLARYQDGERCGQLCGVTYPNLSGYYPPSLSSSPSLSNSLYKKRVKTLTMCGISGDDDTGTMDLSESSGSSSSSGSNSNNNNSNSNIISSIDNSDRRSNNINSSNSSSSRNSNSSRRRSNRG